MTRRSGFGEVSKGAQIGIIVGVVILVIVIGFFIFKSSSSAPEKSETGPELEPVGPASAQSTTNAAPVAFSITSGNTYQIKNVNTGKYLIPTGTTTLSDQPASVPWTITSSGNGYTIKSGNLSLVAYGDLSRGINLPGVYAVPDPNPAVSSWNINITGSNNGTIQNIGKQTAGGVSWLSSINGPVLVASQDSNSTWTFE